MNSIGESVMGRHRAGQYRIPASGFSLVEVMVGLVIGMVAMIVVMQVFSASEATKRTTTGGSDAVTNGAMALYLVKREVAMAGWGLDASLYMGKTSTTTSIVPGCVTLNHFCSGDPSCVSADWSFAPVTITDGAGGGPDTITVRYFSDPENGNFVPPSTGTAYSNAQDASSVPQLKVSANFACKVGDLVLVGDPTGTTCTLVQVSGAPGTTTGNLLLPHQSGGGSTHAYNDPLWDPVTGKPPIVTSNVTLATCFTPSNTGPSSQRIYSIDAGKGALLRSDTRAGIAGETAADGIVDMQAQYGIAADGSQKVSSWVDATPAAGWDSPAPKAGTSGSTTTNRLQNIKAVRIALLARSAQYEKPSSGSSCDATTGSPGTPGTSGWSTWATFKTDNYVADWRCYRYKAFEIVVPIRNVMWGTS